MHQLAKAGKQMCGLRHLQCIITFFYNEITAQTKASRFLSEAYKKGLLSYNGNIRHVLTSDDYDSTTAWEKTSVTKNNYQNGAYWGTPTGWVCFAIAKTNFSLAQKLAEEYIIDLSEKRFQEWQWIWSSLRMFLSSGV